MIPLTRAERYAFARCWGLWRRWHKLEQFNRSLGGRLDRATLYRLWRHIREEMRDE